MQDELDVIYGRIADIKEDIEIEEAKKTTAGYDVKKGTENFVHLMVVQGRRFNPQTGKEESQPFVQIFSRNEWNLFKQHHKALGLSIIKVMHDPYNEAAKYVVK